VRTLILRTWAVDPELCPRCHKEMKRARTLLEQHELQRLLKNLNIGPEGVLALGLRRSHGCQYPMRPRSPPPPDRDEAGCDDLFGAFVAPDGAEVRGDSEFLDDASQVPPDWDEWDAA